MRIRDAWTHTRYSRRFMRIAAGGANWTRRWRSPFARCRTIPCRATGRDPVRAERYLRVYLAQEPEGSQPPTSEARWELGLALQAQGRAAEALAEFKESVRLNPESRGAQEFKRNARVSAAPNSAGPI